jgi:DNA polymerase-3 subunit delta
LSAKKPSRTKIASTGNDVVAVVGSDESEVKRRAKELAIALAPAEGGEFSVDRIDGNADNAEQAVLRIHQTIEAIQTLPFFGGEKLVWLKDINFLSDNIIGRAASVQDALERLMTLLKEGVPPGVRFLLSAPDIDKRRSFYKSLGKTAKVEQFDKIDTGRSGWEEDAAAIIHQRASASGLQFEPEALELFIRLAGADTRQLRNELEKIDLYLGAQRRITSSVVRALVAKTAAGVIWEIGNSISKRQLGRSLALLDQLLFQGETPIGILYAAIIPMVRNLLTVKDLMDRYRLNAPGTPFQFASILSKLPEEATGHLPRKKDGGINTYSLGLAACEAHRFSLSELVAGLEACLEANLQLVTTQLEAKLILSQLLVKLTLQPGQPPDIDF